MIKMYVADDVVDGRDRVTELVACLKVGLHCKTLKKRRLCPGLGDAVHKSLLLLYDAPVHATRAKRHSLSSSICNSFHPPVLNGRIIET